MSRRKIFLLAHSHLLKRQGLEQKIVNSFALSSTQFAVVTIATVASVGDDTHQFAFKLEK